MTDTVKREPLHDRKTHFVGYRREDGLWEVEGELIDSKYYTYTERERGELKPGTPVHWMKVRVVFDNDFTVVDVDAELKALPFRFCEMSTARLKSLIGCRL